MTFLKNSLRIFICTLIMGATLALHSQKSYPLEGRWDLEMDFMGKTAHRGWKYGIRAMQP